MSIIPPAYPASITAPEPNPTDVPPLTLDVNEAARLLRSGRSTVYELIKSGDLASLKIGRRRLVTYASCEALVERLAGQ